MRQTVLESLLQWEENTTAHQPGCHWKHITQWKHPHALTQTQLSFLPLSSVETQKDSPNVTSNGWLLHRGTVGLLQSQLISFPSLSYSLTETHVHKKSISSYKKQVKTKLKTVAILECNLFRRTWPQKCKHPAFCHNNTFKSKRLCFSGWLAGWLAGSVWPPVFTHKQFNLQPDQPVWVWSPMSQSPSNTLSPQPLAYSQQQEVTTQRLPL